MVAESEKNIARAARRTALGRVVNVLNKIVDPLSGKVGAAVAAVILFSMMLLTFLDVAGRGLLNKPLSGTLEISEYMMGIIVAFAIGYTAFRKGHIRVDIIMQFVSRKARLWMDIFTYALSAVFYAIIAWQTWIYAFGVKSTKLTSAVLLIPGYPFVFLVSIGAAFVVLVFLRDFLDAIDKVAE